MSESKDLCERLAEAQEWMRKPDWAERFNLAEISEWIGARPTSLIPAVNAAIEAKDAEIASAVAHAEAAEARLAEAMEALKPFVFGDSTIADILWGGLPDTSTMTMTMQLGVYRRARSVLSGERPSPAKEQP